MLVREATPDDDAQILLLREQYFRSLDREPYPLDGNPSWFVVENEGSIIGTFSFIDYEGERLFRDFYVADKTAIPFIQNHIEETAKAQGIKGLNATVDPSNIRFQHALARHNFIEVSRHYRKDLTT